MRSSSGGLNHRQDWVQDETLLDVFGDVVWIFHCKSKNGVSTNILSKSNHTHGGGIIEINAQDNPRIRLWFILRKTWLYAQVCLKTFPKQVFSYQGAHDVDPHRIQVLNCYRTPRPPMHTAQLPDTFSNNSHQPNHSRRETLVM
jgi:hypothetical protein